MNADRGKNQIFSFPESITVLIKIQAARTLQRKGEAYRDLNHVP